MVRENVSPKPSSKAAEGHKVAVGLTDDSPAVRSPDELSSSESSAMSLHPLTTQAKQDVMTLVNAYGQFFTNPRFREGFMAPAFTREEVDDLLSQAAEYVVRIRHHLDSKSVWEAAERKSGSKRAKRKAAVRLLMGRADDYLWSIKYRPQRERRRFIRGLVHASLQDQAGYVEGLSERQVDAFIAEIDEYYGRLPQHHNRNPDRAASSRSAPNQQQREQVSAQEAIGVTRSTADWAKSVSEMLNQAQQYVGQVTARSANTTATSSDQWVNVCKLLDSLNNQLASMCGLEINHAEKDGESRHQRHQKLKEQAQKAENEKQAQKKDDSALGVHQKPKAVSSESEQTVESASKPTAENGPAQAPVSEATESSKPSGQAAAAPTEKQAQKEETKPAEEPKPSEVDIQVGRVQKNLQEVQGEVQNLLKECHNLNFEALLQGATEGNNVNESHRRALAEKIVREMQGKAVKSSEVLMSDLFKLDQLVCANPDEREKRRQTVKTIQSILDEVDRINNRLKDMQEALASEERRKADEQQQQSEAKSAGEDKEEDQKQSEDTKAPTPGPAPSPVQVQANQTSSKPADSKVGEGESRSEKPDEKGKSNGETGKPAEKSSPKNKQQKEEVGQPSKASTDGAPQKEPASPLKTKASPQPEPLAPTKPSSSTVAVSTPKIPTDPAERLQAIKDKIVHVQEVVMNDENWRNLKMEPKFTVTQQRNRFVIQAYIPYMKRDDISVDLSEEGDLLIIKGFRMPSAEDLKDMLAQLRLAIARGRVSIDKFLGLSDEQLLTTLGGGRYGTFTRQYRLPSGENNQRGGGGGVLKDEISANYSNGALTVIVPIEEGPRFFGSPSLFDDDWFQPFGRSTASSAAPPRRSSPDPFGFSPFFDDFFRMW